MTSAALSYQNVELILWFCRFSLSNVLIYCKENISSQVNRKWNIFEVFGHAAAQLQQMIGYGWSVSHWFDDISNRALLHFKRRKKIMEFCQIISLRILNIDISVRLSIHLNWFAHWLKSNEMSIRSTHNFHRKIILWFIRNSIMCMTMIWW